ncbi:hypothetical protein [Dyella caseinilytica]|uniref:Uncharacterized protein n=1 Tax=Dyella caseinilytica TaxID=1849581 RepID=A0ABX7GTM9_9GAMM|nr:hypothetical protein [Dyella caseinilytica]QRN53669.1 hypothetical protein ISN74_20095 [Dyella caseinilytica]GFZ88361.1 hypothetical protein GCM10011408_03790 [Dyella caseinilytica]
MPEVLFGPPLHIDLETKKVTKLPGVMIDASNVGELFEAYEKATGSYLVPHEPPKYFRYYKSRESSDWILVDVHIHRSDLDICIKQELDFPLMPDDKIVIGALAC